MKKLLLLCAVVAFALPGQARAAGNWSWPVVGPVIRGFDPPDTPYGSGHRGIDIAVSVGTPVRAAAAGVVTFAGPVGGRLFLTIDHGAGLESRYSFLSALTANFGVLLDDVYVDPLGYLGPVEVWRFIRLAPLDV